MAKASPSAGHAPNFLGGPQLRDQGKSWRKVSEALGCSTWAARQAAAAA